MKQKRPINLNLLMIHFPIPAIASILHRISGLILFLFIPLILWVFKLSLTSAEEFDHLRQFLIHPLSKLMLWVVLSAFVYHLIAGIRHLLMDIGIGEELKSGRLGARLTLILSILCIILLGIWIW